MANYYSPSAKKRLALYEAAGYRCQTCGWAPNKIPTDYDGSRYLAEVVSLPSGKSRLWGLDIDHIVPRRLGGGNELANLQVLCTPCNSRKGGR